MKNTTCLKSMSLSWKILETFDIFIRYIEIRGPEIATNESVNAISGETSNEVKKKYWNAFANRIPNKQAGPHNKNARILAPKASVTRNLKLSMKLPIKTEAITEKNTIMKEYKLTLINPIISWPLIAFDVCLLKRFAE